MRKLVSLCIPFCAMLSILASPVRAQNVLWVASNGNDANVCSQTSPCATFQGAINKGNVAEINCLTSGNYGEVTITASIVIDCGTGNVGNIVSTGNAIEINVSTAATIVLRHLSLNGQQNAVNGIVTLGFPSGTLIVEDCAIRGFHGGIGIFFGPTAGRGLLQVSNSLIFDNNFGIDVEPASGQIATVTVNRVELTANLSAGLGLGGGGVVAGTMRDSVAAGNLQMGVVAEAGQVFFTVEESSIMANLLAGILTLSAGSVVNVGTSTIGANGKGVDATRGGAIISFGNNQMSANGSNGSFTGTVSLQ
jgi:hypothetical protein